MRGRGCALGTSQIHSYWHIAVRLAGSEGAGDSGIEGDGNGMKDRLCLLGLPHEYRAEDTTRIDAQPAGGKKCVGMGIGADA